jgi:hypothetical protein
LAALVLGREKRVSRISVWRYLRHFVRSNHYSVCKRNRIGGFAGDYGLPQHQAAVSFLFVSFKSTIS